MEGEGRRGGGAAIGASAKENAVDGQMSEDEKMEKFYALIKSYKESRERMRIEREQGGGVDNGEEERRRKRKRTTKSVDRAAPTWIPAFKWEDFAENSSVIMPTSCESMQGRDCVGRRDDPPPPAPEVEGGGGLDLRLRL